MKKIIRNPAFTILLVIASAVIWVMVIFQMKQVLINSPVIENLGNNNPKYPMNCVIPEGYHDSLFSTLDSIRDPFQKKQKKQIPVSPAPVSDRIPEKVIRKISYIGFLIDSQGPLALIELQDDTTLICREGETHHQIKIQAINPENLTISDRGMNHTIPIFK
jgi:hypothetical protein